MLTDIAQLVVSGMYVGSHYALVAVGFALVSQPRRLLDLSYVASVSIGGYVTLTAVEHWAWPIALAIALGAVTGGAISGLLDQSVFRLLRARSADSLVAMIASLGLMVSLVNGAQLVWGNRHRVLSEYAGESLVLGGVVIGARQLYGLLILIPIVILISWLLRSTSWGVQQRAVAENSTMLRAYGGRVELLHWSATTLGGCIGALGAACLATQDGIGPSTGLILALPAIVVALLGRYWIIAIAGGALVLGVLEESAAWVFDRAWADVVVFTSLAAMLLLRPQVFSSTAKHDA